MSEIDEGAVLRERAREMVARRLTDQEIDFAVRYSDHSDRMIIGHHVREFRADATAAVSHWSEIERAYRDAEVEWGRRPSLDQPAEAADVSVDTMRTWVHEAGIKDYRHIHPLMAKS